MMKLIFTLIAFVDSFFISLDLDFSSHKFKADN